MPVYKVGLIFECEGRGWSETYYKDFGGTFEAARPLVEELANKRAFMMGKPAQIEAFTVEDPLTPGRNGQVFYLNPKLQGVNISESDGACGPSVAVNIGFRNTAQNLSRRIQLRAVWDNAIREWDSLKGSDYANWLTKYNAWSAYLLAQGYGWLHRPIIKNVGASYGYSTGSNTPTFTVPAETFPQVAGAYNYYTSVRFSKFNNSNSALNRELVVLVTGDTTATAAAPIAAQPMITPGVMKLYGAPTFVLADSMGVERVGRRAPGRPLLRTPGRAAARKRV